MLVLRQRTFRWKRWSLVLYKSRGLKISVASCMKIGNTGHKIEWTKSSLFGLHVCRPSTMLSLAVNLMLLLAACFGVGESCPSIGRYNNDVFETVHVLVKLWSFFFLILFLPFLYSFPLPWLVYESFTCHQDNIGLRMRKFNLDSSRNSAAHTSTLFV